MASKRHIRRRACQNKRRYETQALAVASAIGQRKYLGRPLQSYSCSLCGGWHLSTRRTIGAPSMKRWKDAS